MKHRIITFGVVLTVALCIFLMARMSTKSNSTTKIALTNTGTTVSITPSTEANAVLGTTSLPEDGALVQTVVQVVATCSSSQKTILALANEFYQSHQRKDASSSLGAISQPYSQDEQNQLDFWLGTDNQNGTRLYQTPNSNYTVASYTFGNLQDRGQDNDERGSKRCQLTIQENRSVSVTEPNSTQSVTRYLDFAIDAGGNVLLTAFRATNDGEKYSGFGEGRLKN